MNKNKINNYGLNIKAMKQWEIDFLVRNLIIVIAGYEEVVELSKKMTIFIKEEKVWEDYINPLSTKETTLEENEQVDDLKRKFRLCKTTIVDAVKSESDIALKKCMAAILDLVNSYNELSLIRTGKARTLELVKQFLPDMRKQNKKAMAKFGVESIFEKMESSMAKYHEERKKKDKIIADRQGKLTAQRPILNDATIGLLDAIDNNNDPEVGKDGKTTYPYNKLISDISQRFLQLKRRIDKKQQDDDKAEK